MKNYHNPKATFQDHMIAKSFKKGLLRTGLLPSISHGFIPVWGWSAGKPAVVDYEPVHDSFYSIPVAGPNSLRSILSGIRRDKPFETFTYSDTAGTIVTKSISQLSELDLIKALKNLSLVVFEEKDLQKSIRFGVTGDKFIILKTDQLSINGRLGRIPLFVLINKYVGHIVNHGEVYWNFDTQLLDEHKISSSDVDAFCNAAKDLREKLSQCDKSNKSERAKLRRPVRKLISDFCDEVKYKREEAYKRSVDILNF